MLREGFMEYKWKPRTPAVRTKLQQGIYPPIITQGNEIKTQDFHLETHSPPSYSKIISKQQNASAKCY